MLPPYEGYLQPALVRLVGLFRSRALREAEILLLRHQLNVLRRKSPKRMAFTDVDRLVFAGLYHLVRGVNFVSAARSAVPRTMHRYEFVTLVLFWKTADRRCVLLRPLARRTTTRDATVHSG